MRKCSQLSEFPGRNERLVPYVIAVLLLPLLVLWRQDNALFSPPRHTDPWFYLGFFRNLVNFKRDLFPGFYYGSRLAWILPGYLIHSLFSPVTANFILHLAVHSTATLSLFSILRMTAGVRSAFLGTMVFSVHPWLWCATGWDYVNGAGIAWCLLAMALLTRAAAQPARKWSLLLAGMALAAMIHSTFFLLAFAPLLPLYYIGMARSAWRQTPVIRSLASFCLWAGAGFAILTTALCGINYLLDGKLLFWAPSIGAAKTLATTFEWPKLAIWADGRLVPWLWFSVAAIITAIALLPSRLRQEFKGSNAAALLLSADLLLALGYMAYLQSRGIPTLGYYFHAAYLLPFVFLVTGISFWPAVDRMSAGVYGLTCCAAALTFAALWVDPAANILTRSPVSERVMILLAGGALAIGLALRQRMAGTWLALAGFAILTAQAGAGTVNLHGTRAEYERVMHARDRVEAFRHDGVVRFWFDEHDPANLDYWALSNTYLAEFTQIGTGFPQHGCDVKIDPGTLVVVTSSMQDAAQVAQRTLADCWREWGTKPAIQAIDAIERGNQPYTITMVRAEADLPRLHPLRVVLDSTGKASLQFVENSRMPVPFPRESWKITTQPSDRPAMQNTSRGVVVRTPRGSYAFAIEFPRLAVPASGRYRFALRYWLRAGQFAFGARPSDDSRYLAADAAGHPVGGIGGARDMAFFVDLKRGEEVLLRIANNNNSGDGAASFVMGDVTAIEVDP